MAAVEYIGPREAHDRAASGQALLVCAYDDNDKFEHNHLEGSISLEELQEQEDDLPRDRGLVFYCA